MEYYATFTELIDDAVWGVKEVDFQADSIEELKEQIEEFYQENESKRVTYLLDELYDEEGNDLNVSLFKGGKKND